MWTRGFFSSGDGPSAASGILAGQQSEEESSSAEGRKERIEETELEVLPRRVLASRARDANSRTARAAGLQREGGTRRGTATARSARETEQHQHHRHHHREHRANGGKKIAGVLFTFDRVLWSNNSNRDAQRSQVTPSLSRSATVDCRKRTEQVEVRGAKCSTAGRSGGEELAATTGSQWPLSRGCCQGVQCDGKGTNPMKESCVASSFQE